MIIIANSKVKFALLSGRENGAPLTAMSSVGCHAFVPAPPTSQRSSVSYPGWSKLPERRGGSPWVGLTAPPALSLRTEGAKALATPPCTGEARKETPRP